MYCSDGSVIKESTCSAGDASCAGDMGQFLGQEDPLEKEMTTHSSTLAWKIAMDRGVWRAIVHGLQRVGQDFATKQQEALLLVNHSLNLMQSNNSQNFMVGFGP